MTDRKITTILQLKPDACTECSPEDDVLFGSNLMAKNRTHCVLVKDKNENLLGLFTAKDLALRVVANGLNPKITKVKEIMTDTPTCLHMNTPTTEALKIMVERGIRHLPLSDDQGKIKGILDITRCFQQAMLKLERITRNANQINSVLNDVAEDYDHISKESSSRIMKEIEKLSQIISIPTLSSIMKKSKQPVFIDSSANVQEAAKLMKENKTTALLVRDRTSTSRKIIGIFTSKDICFRVLSKEYDPLNCTVARFLTTSPEFAKENMNISTALRLMFQGNFLNLPIVDSKNEIIGIVNVLDLTYAALTQLSKSDELLEAESFGEISLEVKSRLGDDSITWDKFWNKLEKSTDDIHNLESTVIKSPGGSRSQTPKIGSRRSSLNPLTMTSNSRSSSFNARRLSSTISESGKISRNHSSESLSRTTFYIKTKTINFKIKYNNNNFHKINMTINEGVSIYDDIKLLELLKSEIELKLSINLEQNELFYIDEDGDLITISDEFDLIEAINMIKLQDLNTLEIIIKSKSKGFSIIQFFNNCRIKLINFINNESTIFTGTFFVLSMGIILGFTYSNKKLFKG